MIHVPAYVTYPARQAQIELAPNMGGAYGPPVVYGPSIKSLSGIGALGDDTTDTSGGFDWAGLATAIGAGANAATRVITIAQGCPIGTQPNAAGQCVVPMIGAAYPGTPGAAVGTIQTPLGSAALGVSGTTIAMMALAGLVVLVLVLKK